MNRESEWPPPEPVPSMPEHIYPEEPINWAALHCKPQVHETAWIAPGAVVVGRVRLKARSSVWYGCVLRGDAAIIEVGEESNIQDGSILHADEGEPCMIGNRVTLGHAASVHAAVVEDEALIGIRATVLNGCRIGAGALIAAGAVVLEGTVVPPGTLWAGCPARQLRELTQQQQARLQHTWKHYVNAAEFYNQRDAGPASTDAAGPDCSREP